MLPVPFLAKTVVSWTGEQDGDLGFLENEMVRVFHIVDDLWWQGSLLRNGAEGMFPKDFVVQVADLTPSSSPTKSASRSAPVTPVKDTRAKTPNGSFNSGANTPVHSNNLYNGNYRHLPVLKSTPALVLAADEHSKRKERAQYSQYVLSSGLTKAQTVENLVAKKHPFSADSSPVRSKDKIDFHERIDKSDPRVDPRMDRNDFIQSISQKKQQLEMELQALRQLERSHRNRPKLPESSFISEDIVLRNHISDDLGNRLDLRMDLEVDSEIPPPPPPKHKTVPFDADDFRASGSSDLRASADLKASIKSLQSDVLNLSELSATSAGSFMRHKYDNHMAEADARMSKVSLHDDVMDVVFQEKKPKSNIFSMLKKKRPENLMEQRLLREQDTWQVKVDVNRMNSLALLDKQARTKRAVSVEPNFIVKPLEFVTDINVSETFGPDDISFTDMGVNLRKTADFVDKYDYQSDFNDLISDISVKFGNWRPNEIRCALLHLCKFHIIEEPEIISQTKPRLHEVMAKGEATIFQLNYLFKKFLAALGIPSEVVLGFWKKPNEFYHSDQFAINHCWLSVMVETDDSGNGCFRIIDLMCFQNGSICNKAGFNEYYFLAEPVDLLSTHIPSVIELQHVTPPIDLNVAFHLPRMYSGFKKNGLQFVNFNNALTRMHDAEFFEADLIVPPNVELFTLIKSSRSTSNDYSLCQIYWTGQKRMAKVKAILPDNEGIGVLQIFAGPKGTQTHFDNIHELACVVPLYHTGKGKPCKFVPRFPTIQSQNNDLYIRHPQLSSISAKNAYNFEVEAHPSKGVNSGSGLMNQDFKLVIESPSGKYTKLVKDEPYKPHGTYRSNILCQEQGLYRALVIGDSGNSWYVFAQWECA